MLIILIISKCGDDIKLFFNGDKNLIRVFVLNKNAPFLDHFLYLVFRQFAALHWKSIYLLCIHCTSQNLLDALAIRTKEKHTHTHTLMESTQCLCNRWQIVEPTAQSFIAIDFSFVSTLTQATTTLYQIRRIQFFFSVANEHAAI